MQGWAHAVPSGWNDATDSSMVQVAVVHIDSWLAVSQVVRAGPSSVVAACVRRARRGTQRGASAAKPSAGGRGAHIEGDGPRLTVSLSGAKLKLSVSRARS